MDVSGSMRANDVKPNRIAAAQAAAQARSSTTSRATRASAWSRSPAPPRWCRRRRRTARTSRRDRPLPAAARHRGRQRHPGLAEGAVPGCRVSTCSRPIRAGDEREGGAARSTSSSAAGRREFKPVPPGSYKSAVIILLTDGQTTTGPDPLEAAQDGRRARRARLHRRRRHADGEILAAKAGRCACAWTRTRSRTIANMTRGEYFYAGKAADLKKIYESPQLPAGDGEEGDRDHRALFAAVGGVLALLAAGSVDAVVQPDTVAAARSC